MTENGLKCDAGFTPLKNTTTKKLSQEHKNIVKTLESKENLSRSWYESSVSILLTD